MSQAPITERPRGPDLSGLKIDARQRRDAGRRRWPWAFAVGLAAVLMVSAAVVFILGAQTPVVEVATVRAGPGWAARLAEREWVCHATATRHDRGQDHRPSQRDLRGRGHARPAGPGPGDAGRCRRAGASRVRRRRPRRDSGGAGRSAGQPRQRRTRAVAHGSIASARAREPAGPRSGAHGRR